MYAERNQTMGYLVEKTQRLLNKTEGFNCGVPAQSYLCQTTAPGQPANWLTLKGLQ